MKTIIFVHGRLNHALRLGVGLCNKLTSLCSSGNNGAVKVGTLEGSDPLQNGADFLVVPYEQVLTREAFGHVINKSGAAEQELGILAIYGRISAVSELLGLHVAVDFATAYNIPYCVLSTADWSYDTPGILMTDRRVVVKRREINWPEMVSGMLSRK